MPLENVMTTVARLIARWITASPPRAVVIAVLLAAGSAVILPAFAAAGEGLGSKPTVVVVHGSSAESASWDRIFLVFSRRATPSSRRRIRCAA